MSQYTGGELSEEIEVRDMYIKVTTLNYTWDLSTLTPSRPGYLHMNSPLFYAYEQEDPSWYLCLRDDTDNPEFYSAYLNLSCREKLQVRGKFRFILLSNEGEEVTSNWSKSINFVVNEKIGIHEFVKKDLLDNVMQNNLQLVCSVSYAIQDFYVVVQENNPTLGQIQNELCENFADLLENEKFSDVTFLVEGTKFRAHKAILAARSNIFADMFELTVNGKKIDCLQIKQTEQKVFQELLEYIYTGNLRNLEKYDRDLMVAAKMYGLEKLQQICQESICSHFSEENLVAALILADAHDFAELKAAAIDAIIEKINEVKKTDDWLNMQVNHNDLVFEIFEALATQE